MTNGETTNDKIFLTIFFMTKMSWQRDSSRQGCTAFFLPKQKHTRPKIISSDCKYQNSNFRFQEKSVNYHSPSLPLSPSLPRNSFYRSLSPFSSPLHPNLTPPSSHSATDLFYLSLLSNLSFFFCYFIFLLPLSLFLQYNLLHNLSLFPFPLNLGSIIFLPPLLGYSQFVPFFMPGWRGLMSQGSLYFP